MRHNAAGSGGLNHKSDGRKSALVIDDNTFEHIIITLLLEDLGYRVIRAVDGNEALSQLGVADFHFIFVDCELPTMDGFDIVRLIRAGSDNESRRNVTIIGMSSSRNKNYRQKMLLSGADFFLLKPFDHITLSQTIEQAGKQPRMN